MTASIVFGILGASAVWGLGRGGLGLSHMALLRLCAVSNLAAFLGVWATVRLERNPWIKKRFLPGGWSTWTLLSGIYLGLLLLGSPEFRSGKVAVVLLLPLIFAGSFAFPVFGWIQDRWVRRIARPSPRA